MPKRRAERIPRTIPVSIELGGQTYEGTYFVSQDMITVSSGWGTRTTQLGGTPPYELARMLLAEIVHQKKDS